MGRTVRLLENSTINPSLIDGLLKLGHGKRLGQVIDSFISCWHVDENLLGVA